MRPILLGHRGARKYAPENTLSALQLALDHGCDGFEFDVRLTSDAHAVICHDPKFGGRAVDRSRRDELDVPTLEDVLHGFAAKAFLNIELKVAGAESCTIELLQKYASTRGVIVSSFLPDVVLRLSDLGAAFPIALICESQKQLARWSELPIKALMLHRGLVTKTLVGELKEAGIKVFAWTVNDPRDMRRFAELRLEGIISDDTKLLVETLTAS